MVRLMHLADPASGTRPSPHRGLVLAAATLGFGVIQLDVSVVNVAVKPIGAALGGGVTGLQWVVDAYTLTFAALIVAAGAQGDRCGTKRVLLGGFAVFTLASVACGLVPAIGALIAARAVQGIGAAALGGGPPRGRSAEVTPGSSLAGAISTALLPARARVGCRPPDDPAWSERVTGQAVAGTRSAPTRNDAQRKGAMSRTDVERATAYV